MRGERKATAAKLHLPFPLARPTRSLREPRPARADRVEAPTWVRSGSGETERLPRWLPLPAEPDQATPPLVAESPARALLRVRTHPDGAIQVYVLEPDRSPATP